MPPDTVLSACRRLYTFSRSSFFRFIGIFWVFFQRIQPYTIMTSTFSTPPSPCQSVKPLPDLPLEIWIEIFQFATYVHTSATVAPLDPFTLKRTSNNVMGPNTPSLSTRTKLSLVLVSRAWRRVAVQSLYEHLVVRSPTRANLILGVLQGSCQTISGKPTLGYGQWTRHIEVYTYARGAGSIRYLETIFHILQCCPSLRMLSGIWTHPLPIEFLRGISKLYGPSLEGLYWNEQTLSPSVSDTVATPEFLASFHALRVLDLRNFIGNDLSKCSGKTSHALVLPQLQDLIISTHPRSLAMATALSLPALRNLTLKTRINGIPYDLLNAFLKAHGVSLIRVDLPSPSLDSEPEPDTAQPRRTAQHINPDIFLQQDVCPNLVTITFPATSPPLAPQVHTSLRSIGLRGVRADGLYPDKPTQTKGHLMSFTTERYPNLEVVRTVGFLVDADVDVVAKDVFIWWTERFERQGIDFLDGEGVLWVYTDPVEVFTEGDEVGGRLETAVGASKQCSKLQLTKAGMSKEVLKMVENSHYDW